MSVKQWAINIAARAIREIRAYARREPKRKDLLKILPPGSVGAELGVFKGEFTKYLLKIARPKRLHLIDPWWRLYGEYYPDWEEYTDFGRLKTSEAFEKAKRTVDKYDKKKVCEFHVDDDLECLKEFQDNYFDWIYLDTSHKYDHTKKELEILKDKVKNDGLIMGHDYSGDPNHIHYGVYKAVNEFCKKYRWEVIKLDHFCQFCIKRSCVAGENK